MHLQEMMVALEAEQDAVQRYSGHKQAADKDREASSPRGSHLSRGPESTSASMPRVTPWKSTPFVVYLLNE